MRGSDMRTGELFSYVDLEERVPSDHRLRLIRRIVNEVFATLDREFAELYAAQGDRRSRWSGCCGRFCCRRVLHHPLGTSVDGAVALQSALSLVRRSRRG